MTNLFGIGKLTKSISFVFMILTLLNQMNEEKIECKQTFPQVDIILEIYSTSFWKLFKKNSVLENFANSFMMEVRIM